MPLEGRLNVSNCTVRQYYLMTCQFMTQAFVFDDYNELFIFTDIFSQMYRWLFRLALCTDLAKVGQPNVQMANLCSTSPHPKKMNIDCHFTKQQQTCSIELQFRIRRKRRKYCKVSVHIWSAVSKFKGVRSCYNISNDKNN